MTNISEKIKKHAQEADTGWGSAYGRFSKIIERKELRTGVEIGVAFGGHAQSLLNVPTIERLYGVDPYRHINGYKDAMNLSQKEFEQVYAFARDRLSCYHQRYRHIRKLSKDAVVNVPEIDFVYIDADHSYQGVWNDLCCWYQKIRIGGIIGGHDYGHPDFPGVQQAIDKFFKRFNQEIHLEGAGVWWVEKQSVSISFIMPAYNCAKTIRESVESIMRGNFTAGDELIIVNDCSTDSTEKILHDLAATYPSITTCTHTENKGGGAARNTAVEHAHNEIIFCLDSDNILVPGSIKKLKMFLAHTGAAVASFQELHFFKSSPKNITHKWRFNAGVITTADCLAGPIIPGSSGNYMFTKKSWADAGGYPEFAGALDAWGFGFRQLATGSQMMVLPGTFYYHRYGHESYWDRESKNGKTSLLATQIISPFFKLLYDEDIRYILDHRKQWFFDLEKRPIRVTAGHLGASGIIIWKGSNGAWTSTLVAFFRMLHNSLKKLCRGKR